VAVQALIIVVENGFQTVLMAPTEILAEQHYETLTRYLEEAGYSIALLTARVKGKERKTILQGLAAGEIQIAIGTHAVFQKGVSFHRLGFVVIDEQHRFGVRQRSQLQQKGERPDTLVMTATPIPRSLALTLYGDLDLSIIDELPPGRQPIRTVLRRDAERQKVYAGMRDEIRKGRQCYIVFPLVEESEKLELRAATEMARQLQQTVFADLEVALIHGRLSGEEKAHTMARFKRGEIDVLVSTTVIEVGIDVPNASLMVIEHANRFGLSQLHQLRGRIGRGKDKSYCVLLSEPGGSADARERLRIMQETNDGFRLAEKDLELRGPGDFVGTKQSGIPQFRFANLVRDRAWLERARLDAQEWLDRVLKSGPPEDSFGELSEEWERRFGLFRVG
jgi:ATP-dependent DNA helicase RecG